ncbi:hypothetical protein GUJ93_ZPchr0004g39422 [Zizania palustris]|uniref:Uncharacterized protein n=1 Tax=Zizania palustris TaxID=103762 RepID=A0A8J5S156_ZIZPA|nr:hypothetical protein GUJ93_ZPchr0004g39422 [Zizania palustris]
MPNHILVMPPPHAHHAFAPPSHSCRTVIAYHNGSRPADVCRGCSEQQRHGVRAMRARRACGRRQQEAWWDANSRWPMEAG